MEGSGIAITILLLIFESAFIFVLFMIGGKYLRSKLKEAMPWNRYKGSFTLFLDKTGTFFLDYVLLKGKNKIARKNKHDILLTQNHHSFVDLASKDTNFVSVHKMDRVPLYLVVEGSPTNVLAKFRDFDKDIFKLKGVYKYVQKVIQNNSITNYKKANFKIVNLFLNLRDTFKYLPEAKELCEQAAYLASNKQEYTEKDYQELFANYLNAFSELGRILKKKNKTFVNFREFFNEGNISALFNKITREYEQLGRMAISKKESKMDKALKIGGGIFLVAMGLIAFLIVDQGNKIEDVTNQLNKISNKIDESITVGSIDTNQGVSPSPSNSPVSANAASQGDAHTPYTLSL